MRIMTRLMGEEQAAANPIAGVFLLVYGTVGFLALDRVGARFVKQLADRRAGVSAERDDGKPGVYTAE